MHNFFQGGWGGTGVEDATGVEMKIMRNLMFIDIINVCKHKSRTNMYM